MRSFALCVKRGLILLLLARCIGACSRESNPDPSPIPSSEPEIDERVLRVDDDLLILKSQNPEPSLGLSSYQDISTWEYGIVPYEIDPALDETTKQQLAEAVNHYRERTGLRLVPLAELGADVPRGDYLRIEHHTRCSSYFGRIGDQQLLRIAPYGEGCNKDWGTLIHELGHTFGALHEQLHPALPSEQFRKDRIAADSLAQYEHDADRSAIGLSSYDPGSVMHYSFRQGSICTSGTSDENWNGVTPAPGCMTGDGKWQSKVIEVDGQSLSCRQECAPVIDSMGQPVERQRVGLSAGDIAGLRVLYPIPFSIDKQYRSILGREATAQEIYRQGRKLAQDPNFLQQLRQELRSSRTPKSAK